MSRSESLEHAGRRLLGERSALRQSLAASQQLLSGLTAAFDPLSPGQAARQEDVLQAADRLHATAAALSNRLVGVGKKVMICSCSTVHIHAITIGNLMENKPKIKISLKMHFLMDFWEIRESRSLGPRPLNKSNMARVYIIKWSQNWILVARNSFFGLTPDFKIALKTAISN